MELIKINLDSATKEISHKQVIIGTFLSGLSEMWTLLEPVKPLFSVIAYLTDCQHWHWHLVEQEFLRNSYLGLSTNEDSYSKTVYFSLFSILQRLFIPELCSRLGHIGLEQEPIWGDELCEFVVYWFDYSDSLSRKNTLTTRFITVFCDQHWSHLASSSSSQLAHIITHRATHHTQSISSHHIHNNTPNMCI